MNRSRMILGVSIAGLTLSTFSGCVQRRVEITSEPSGARVWLNDEMVGVTPCEAGFKYYGKYDVRLDLDGYEPVHEGRVMKAPIYEYPVIDLAATAVPANIESVNEWHFVLTPTGEVDREELIGRANELRGDGASVGD